MLLDPLHHIGDHRFRGLLLRRTMAELRDLMDLSRQIYPAADEGAKYNAVDKFWQFSSGARQEFGFLDNDGDKYRYQGRAWQWLGIDELTQFPDEATYLYLHSRLRAQDQFMKCFIRATTNPGGPGHSWVHKRFVEPAPPNTIIRDRVGNERMFMPSRLKDNPHLGNDYRMALESLPQAQRKAYLYGDWNVFEGAVFTEWDPDLHICEPFEIPIGWAKLRSGDYGYGSRSAIQWWAVDPDGNMVCYRELYVTEMDPSELGRTIYDIEHQNGEDLSGPLDPSCWHKTGHLGPTIAETMWREGVRWQRADNSKVAGIPEFHRRLKKITTYPDGLRIPGARWFSTCHASIGTIPAIRYDPKNSEDIDSRSEDHCFDAARYAFMARPMAGDGVTKKRVWEIDEEQERTPRRLTSTSSYGD